MLLPARFHDDDFQRAFDALLDEARWGADADELITTARRISDGDADAWVLEWIGAGGAAWAAAHQALRSARPRSALLRFLHAAACYEAALALIDRSGERDREADIWGRQRACWEHALAALGGERLAIAYEGSALPAAFVSAGADAPRPLVIVVNGAARATSSLRARAGAAAAARGWHWLALDGPGQGGALRDQRLLARPDWEAVLTPVLDAMLARPDVDATRVVAIGLDEGGLWLTRALAFEHRLAAAAVEPGVVDLATPWLKLLPPKALAALDACDWLGFARELRIATLFDPALGARLERLAAPFGSLDAGALALQRSIASHRLGDELAQVRTPLLVAERAGERDFPGQGRRLHDALDCRRALLAAAGPAERERRIFAWLDAHLLGVEAIGAR